MSDDKIRGYIYESNNYDAFRLLKNNREINEAVVRKIIKSVQNVGYVLSPILVNENMEIIDGQHRFEAFKRLGLTIVYCVQEGAGVKECQSLNIGQSNWRTMDFIKSYAGQGNENYVRLLHLLGENQRLGFDSVMLFVDSAKGKRPSATGGRMAKPLTSGEFTLSLDEYTVANARLESVKRLGLVEMFKKSTLYARSFWGAISFVYMYASKYDDFDIRRFAQKLIDNRVLITDFNRIEDHLTQFDDMYNKGKRNGLSCLALEYKRR